MATQILTATLGLSAANAINGIFSLNASETDSISYDDTAASSATVSAPTGAGGVQLVAASVAKKTYAYVKNLDTTNFVYLENDANDVWGRLGPNEFAFFPVGVSVGCQVRGDTAACTIEYALFQEP